MNYRIVIFAGLILGAAAFSAGRHFPQQKGTITQPLRLSGFAFISPLLMCNNVKNFPEYGELSKRVEKVIDDNVEAGNISKASTFFIDFSSGNWSDTYPNEKYYPSSLGKIPIMMAYYELAQKDPQILGQKITYPMNATDLNQSQDIPPKHAIARGMTYSIDYLISYMIIDSDNNATDLLYRNIDTNSLVNIYHELGIPLEGTTTISNLDFVNPQQVSTLFRVLYNSTFLSREYSERALDLMSRSTFTKGIVKGVPEKVVVTHKLGLVGVAPNGRVSEHELHDCGIVYAPNHPYALCIMTRGSAPISGMEDTISQISKTVYDATVSQ